MRNSTFEYRNLNQVFLCSLSALGNSSCYLTCLTKTVTNNTIAITNNDDCSECEGTTTFCNLSYTVDSYQAIL